MVLIDGFSVTIGMYCMCVPHISAHTCHLLQNNFSLPPTSWQWSFTNDTQLFSLSDAIKHSGTAIKLHNLNKLLLCCLDKLTDTWTDFLKHWIEKTQKPCCGE